eukprot:scaffold8.g1710.t1
MDQLARTSEAHLDKDALRRHGPPDLRLRVGSTTFPVHRGVVAAASGLLAGLLSDLGAGADELCLPASFPLVLASTGSAASVSDAPAAPPEAASSPEAVALLLALVYHTPSHRGIKSPAQADQLSKLADWLDCPCALSAIDTYKATQLDQSVLVVLLGSLVHTRGFGCTDHSTCKGETHSLQLPAACSPGPVCDSCRKAQELQWREAAEVLERELLACGWDRS